MGAARANLRARIGGVKRDLIRVHELRRIRKPGQRRLLKSTATEIKSRLAVPVREGMHTGRKASTAVPFVLLLCPKLRRLSRRNYDDLAVPGDFNSGDIHTCLGGAPDGFS